MFKEMKLANPRLKKLFIIRKELAKPEKQTENLL